MRRVLAYLIVLVALTGLAAGGLRLAADRTTMLDRFKDPTTVRSATPRPSTVPGPVPAPGQAFITGAVDKLTAEGAQGAPIPAPFTLAAAERGAGRATIENALVDGKRTSIAWGGGTPLPVTGDGSIDLAGATVDIDPAGLTWHLDGAPRSLNPGHYRIGATVAVGVGGLATPRDAVDFTADERTQVQATGGIVIKVPPAKVELTGPGKVAATGSMQVRDTQTTMPAATITFGEGPYKITLTPAAGRFQIDAILQGPLKST